MTELIFNIGQQFGGCRVLLRHVEQRVVAKPLCAPGLTKYFAAPVPKGNDGCWICCALHERHAAEEEGSTVVALDHLRK